MFLYFHVFIFSFHSLFVDDVVGPARSLDAHLFIANLSWLHEHVLVARTSLGLARRARRSHRLRHEFVIIGHLIKPLV